MRELFDQAFALPKSQRAKFLEKHCSNAQQRAQLQQLLDAADAIGESSALAGDPLEWAQHIGESTSAEFSPIGSMLGPFHLEALLGEGASAHVYRATRSHQGVTQTFALKVLRHGLASANARLQFDRERHALARLNHPNIARLMDGGVTELGVAYIALEFVDGVDLLSYVRQQQLSSRQRVELMIEVARTVSAAHQSLVVHRDLKPANILVSHAGEIKLLDFGVAKLLQSESGDDSQTQSQFRAFTPAYAAPEQHSGDSITTATDVFALGIILGEMLTGERLNDGGSSKPSQRVSENSDLGVLPFPPKQTRKLLRGDLDNILAKATAIEPHLRYHSAASFADDLTRFLAHQPVHAHPPSQWYRISKFVARHRGGVTIAVLVSSLVLSALGVALWQGHIAQQEASRARAVTDFLINIFRAAEERLPENQRPTPEQLIQTAKLQLREQPSMAGATRAEIEFALAEVSRLSAQFAEADTLYVAAASSLGDVPVNHPLALQIGIGKLHVLQELGEHPQVFSASKTLLALLENNRADWHIAVLKVLASSRMANGEVELALQAARRQLQIASEHYNASSIDALTAKLFLGLTLTAAEKHREAATELSPSLQLWRDLALPLNSDYMSAASAEATTLYALGELQNAQTKIEHLLKLQRDIYQEPHHVIAHTLRNYAMTLAAAGNIDMAIDTHKQSIAMSAAIFGEGHERLINGYSQLGMTLANAGNPSEAALQYQSALAICDQQQLSNVLCTRTRNNLGMIFYRLKDYTQARAHMEVALKRFREIYGENHLNIAVSLTTLSNVLSAEKQYEQAIAYSEKALAIMQFTDMLGSRDELLMRNGLAAALWGAGRNERALQEIEYSIEGFDRVQPNVLNRRVMMRVLHAQILRDLGRGVESRKVVDAAIALNVPAEQLSENTRQLLAELSGRKGLYPDF